MGLHRVLRAVSIVFFVGAGVLGPDGSGIYVLLLFLVTDAGRSPQLDTAAYYGALFTAMGVTALELLAAAALPHQVDPGIAIPGMLAGVLALALPASAAGRISSTPAEPSPAFRGALFATLFQLAFLCLFERLLVHEIFHQYMVFGMLMTLPPAFLAGLLAGRPAATMFRRLAGVAG